MRIGLDGLVVEVFQGLGPRNIMVRFRGRGSSSQVWGSAGLDSESIKIFGPGIWDYESEFGFG